MIEQIFDTYKGPSGSITKDEYRAFLQGIGEWGSGNYTDDGWDKGWPAECKLIRTTADKGADLPAFVHLYTQFRANKIESDFQKVTGVSSVFMRLDNGILPSEFGACSRTKHKVWFIFLRSCAFCCLLILKRNPSRRASCEQALPRSACTL